MAQTPADTGTDPRASRLVQSQKSRLPKVVLALHHSCVPKRARPKSDSSYKEVSIRFTSAYSAADSEARIDAFAQRRGGTLGSG